MIQSICETELKYKPDFELSTSGEIFVPRCTLFVLACEADDEITMIFICKSNTIEVDNFIIFCRKSKSNCDEK